MSYFIDFIFSPHVKCKGQWRELLLAKLKNMCDQVTSSVVMGSAGTSVLRGAFRTRRQLDSLYSFAITEPEVCIRDEPEGGDEPEGNR